VAIFRIENITSDFYIAYEPTETSEDIKKIFTSKIEEVYYKKITKS